MTTGGVSTTGGARTGGAGGEETGGEETGGEETGGSGDTGGAEAGGATTGGAETGGTASGGDGTGGAPTEDPPLLINACASAADYVDLTAPAASRVVEWVNPSNSCFKISLGQTVTWSGAFGPHPLEAHLGETPSPIPSYSGASATVMVTFEAVGTFGFRCTLHPSTMRGAIWVVP